MKYWYKVMGYVQKIDKLRGEELCDVVVVHVTAENEAEAIDIAKKIIKKPLYRIAEAGQINPDLLSERELREKNYELNKQVVDNNKGTLDNNIKMQENMRALADAIEKLKA